VHVSCHDAIERITSQPAVNYQTVNNKGFNVLQLAVIKGDITSVVNSLFLLFNFINPSLLDRFIAKSYVNGGYRAVERIMSRAPSESVV